MECGRTPFLSFRPAANPGSSCSIIIRRKAWRSRKTPAPIPAACAILPCGVDDIAAVTAKLRAAGIEVWGEPTAVPGGVVKFDTGAGGKTLVYFVDPDGVIVELAEYR